MKNTYVMLAASFFLFTAPAQAAEYTVRMVSDEDKGMYAFDPGQLTIKSGDTVTWVNAQDGAHDVMSESVPEGAEPFESLTLKKKGQKWSYTFTHSGTYEYHCHPHEELGMKGVVIVDKPSEARESGHHHGASLTAAQAFERLQGGKPVYSCPMHMDAFSGAPGQCPVCGMNLQRVKDIKDGAAVFEDEKQDMHHMHGIMGGGK